MQKPDLVERENKRLHDAARDRNRATLGAQQASHAERAVDGTPSIPFDVERDEDVPGKNRRDRLADFAAMPNCLTKTRQKDLEALRGEVDVGQIFPVMQGLCDVPALAVPNSKS